jgi:hypothetical protein
MATIDIDFQWGVGHEYQLVDDQTAIRQTSRRHDWRRPLQTFSNLYLKFAELDGSPKACLEFARSWGLLRQPAKLDASEPLSDWKREIKQMRGLFNRTQIVKTGGIRARMTKIDVDLVSLGPDINSPTILRFRPPTLFDAMVVQLTQSQASGASLASCTQCGHWFEVGGSGKRSVSKFCSDGCRNRFHYEQRTKTP